MERGQPSNNKGKGKEKEAGEEQAGAGDDNNINPRNIVDTSYTNLDLGLAQAQAPHGAAAEEIRLGAAADVLRRTSGTGADGSSTGRRKMHKCKYCEKEFSTSQALGGHQNAHKPERVAAKIEESLGKMGAMGRDHMNISGRYQPYYFNQARTLKIGGPAPSVLNLGPSGVPPTRQQPLNFQSPHSSFLSLGNRFPAPGQVPPPVPRQGGGNGSGSQGFSQIVRSWSEYLLKPRNATSEAGSSNPTIDRSAGVGSSTGDGRRLMYYPGGIGFGPQSITGNNPNANVNRNLNLLGHNVYPNPNPFGNVRPNVNPTGNNVIPFNNVGANIGVAAAAPPADDHGDEDENEGDQEELDLNLKL